MEPHDCRGHCRDSCAPAPLRLWPLHLLRPPSLAPAPAGMAEAGVLPRLDTSRPSFRPRNSRAPAARCLAVSSGPCVQCPSWSLRRALARRGPWLVLGLPPPLGACHSPAGGSRSSRDPLLRGGGRAEASRGVGGTMGQQSGPLGTGPVQIGRPSPQSGPWGLAEACPLPSFKWSSLRARRARGHQGGEASEVAGWTAGRRSLLVLTSGPWRPALEGIVLGEARPPEGGAEPPGSQFTNRFKTTDVEAPCAELVLLTAFLFPRGAGLWAVTVSKAGPGATCASSPDSSQVGESLRGGGRWPLVAQQGPTLGLGRPHLVLSAWVSGGSRAGTGTRVDKSSWSRRPPWALCCSRGYSLSSLGQEAGVGLCPRGACCPLPMVACGARGTGDEGWQDALWAGAPLLGGYGCACPCSPVCGVGWWPGLCVRLSVPASALSSWCG